MTREKSGKKYPTLADIAKQTNYSISTVSKVLNDQSDISNSAKQEINAILDASGYRRKVRHRHHEEFIDVVFSEFENIWAMEVLRGAIREAAKDGINITVTESGNRKHPAANWAKNLVGRHPLGAVLIFSNLSEEERKELDKNEIFYSIFDPSGEPRPEDYSVRADNWNGGTIAARHLLELGHQNIGVITGPRTMMCSIARLEGFRAALAEKDVHLNSELIKEGRFDTSSGFQRGMELLSLPASERPTAIFAGSDLQAMGVYEAARQLGLKVPQDLSVIGFDDIQTAAYMNPPLTTVRQPLQQMAAMATRMVIERVNHRTSDPHVVAPTTLVLRDSTARLQ